MADQFEGAPSNPLMDSLDTEAKKWPKVVGIISIVWAGIGLACGGCGVAFMAFMPQLMKGAEQQMGGPMPAAMQPSPVQMAVGVVGIVWTIVLLTAGISLVTRKPAARTMHLVYASLAIVIGIVGIGLQVQQQAALAEYFRQNPGDPWGKNQSSVGSVIGLAVGAIISFAWPVFCLVWFGVIKRRSQEITQGIAETVA